MTIQTKMRELRLNAGLSIVAMSRVINLDPAYLAQVETEFLPVNQRVIKLYCEAVGLEYEAF